MNRTARAALAAALLAAAGCTERESRPVSPGDGVMAEEFRLPDLGGKTVSLSDYKGKIVFLDFWATWCEPCVEEIPDLIELHKSFSAQGFSVVGVAVETPSQKDVADFATANKIPYPILYATERPEGYRIRALPTAYLIDRRGRLRQRYLGMIEPLDVRRDVLELLKEGT